MTDKWQAKRELVMRKCVETRHVAALGMEFAGIDETGVSLRLPYDERFIGEPSSGVIAGGAVMALMDHCCGIAVGIADDDLEDFDPNLIVTLDLRIDYMRAAAPGKDLIAKGQCYKRTRTAAFVRAVAHDGDPSDPVAAALAVFMVVDPPKPPAAS